MLVTACTLDLGTFSDFPDAVIQCESNDECPEEFVCSSSGQCAPALANVAPTVTVDLAIEPRALDDVPLRLNILDLNDEDTLALAVTYRVDGGDPLPATIERTEFPAVMETSDPYVVTWSALDDATDNGGETELARYSPVLVDTTTQTETAPSMLRLARRSVTITATVTDNRGATGTATAGPFVIGNDAPTVELESEAVLAGVAPLLLTIADSDATLADVQVEVRTDGDWFAADMFANDVNQLAPREAPYVARWRSASDISAGGVGFANLPAVQLRARAGESTGSDPAGVLQFGDWFEFGPVEVRNQSAPTVSNVEILNLAGTGIQGIVAVAFSLVDEQSDRVDLDVEFATDDTNEFLTATEFPSFKSSGTAALASAPTLDGGVRHVFLWDGFRDLGGGEHAGRIRLTARETNTGGERQFLDGEPVVVGAGEVGNSADLDDPGTGGGLVSGEFELATTKLGVLSSSVLDVVALRTDGELQLFDLLGPPGWTVDEEQLVGSNVVAFDLGDVSGSDRDDLVLVTSTGLLELRVSGVGFGDIVPNNDTQTITLSTGALDVALGLIDSDELLDAVVLLDDNSVAVYYGNGNSTGDRFAEPPVIYAEAVYTRLELADADGDGRDDLWLGSAPSSIEVVRGETLGGTVERRVLTPAVFNPWVVGDVNGDGAGDITSAGDGALTQWHATGGDALMNGVEQIWRQDSANSRALELQDVDGDGLLDVLRWSTPRLDVHRSAVGTGSVPFITASANAFNPCLQSMTFGDLDGAAGYEAVAYRFGVDCESPGALGFGPLAVLDIDWGGEAPFGASRPDLGTEHIGLFDLNRDGVADRVWGKGDAVSWQFGQGELASATGRFFARAERKLVPQDCDTTDANSLPTVDRIFVADFTNDDLMDVFAELRFPAGYAGCDPLYFLAGTGSGFEAPVSYALSELLAVGDLDGEDAPELVTTQGIHPGRLVGSTLSFDTPMPLNSGLRTDAEALAAIVHADFDGDPEIALVGRREGTGGGVSLVTGAGEPFCDCGGLCRADLEFGTNLIRGFEASDFDADGRLDVSVFVRPSAAGEDRVFAALRSPLGECPSFSNDAAVVAHNSLNEGAADTFQPLSSGDLNRDGTKQLTFSNHRSASTIQIVPDSSGGIDELLLTDQPQFLEVQPALPSDLNGDGQIDVLGTAIGEGASALIPGLATVGWETYLRAWPAVDLIGLPDFVGAMLPATHPMLRPERYANDLEDEPAAWVRGAGLLELQTAGDDWGFVTVPMHVLGALRGVGERSENGVARLAIQNRVGPVGADGELAGLDLTNGD
ncbi:MAG: VCBS repeat-containing protein, partial [Myxococcota bacterium]